MKGQGTSAGLHENAGGIVFHLIHQWRCTQWTIPFAEEPVSHSAHQKQGRYGAQTGRLVHTTAADRAIGSVYDWIWLTELTFLPCQVYSMVYTTHFLAWPGHIGFLRT